MNRPFAYRRRLAILAILAAGGALPAASLAADGRVTFTGELVDDIIEEAVQPPAPASRVAGLRWQVSGSEILVPASARAGRLAAISARTPDFAPLMMQCAVSGAAAAAQPLRRNCQFGAEGGTLVVRPDAGRPASAPSRAIVTLDQY